MGWVVAGGTQFGNVQLTSVGKAQLAVEQQPCAGHHIGDPLGDGRIGHTVWLRFSLPTPHTFARAIPKTGIIGTIWQCRVEGHAIEQIFGPRATGNRQPGRTDKLGKEGKAGVARTEEVTLGH